jgi:hypothetical protein
MMKNRKISPDADFTAKSIADKQDDAKRRDKTPRQRAGVIRVRYWF